jgi:general stress protein 26
VAREDSRKIGEIARDPNINLSYYKERTREWISVSGAARICRDRAKIRELYEPTWKAWFPNDGGLRDGGPEDPRMVLIGVEARSAQFAKLDRAATMVIGG